MSGISERLRVAYHEAGHIIVGRFFGLRVTSACSLSKSGEVNFDKRKKVYAWERAVVLVSGYCSEKMFCDGGRRRFSFSSHYSCVDDFKEYMSIMGCGKETISADCREANAILRANKKLVDKVVNRFLSSANLSRKDLGEINKMRIEI